jgi:hypothetical protein
MRTNVKPDYKALVAMLSYRRPHGSKAEKEFIKRFITSLGAVSDEFGNRYLTVGESPRVMWSCHTDSVHRMGGRQRVASKMVDERYILKLSESEKTSNCLGADNAAGVWMMREMIIAGVPGLYVFHRQEETGGHGSTHFAKNSRHLLTGIEAAIAFDRRRKHSIITHQGWGMTASDEFANSLADMLGMGHKPDSGGIFTDTANYSDIIPECSNISAGFENEHSVNETLDVTYLLDLRDAIIDRFSENDLVIARTAGDDGYGKSGYHSFSSYRDPITSGSDYHRLRELCRTRPEEVADWLEMNGVTPEEIEDHIFSSYGYSSFREDSTSDWVDRIADQITSREGVDD